VTVTACPVTSLLVLIPFDESEVKVFIDPKKKAYLGFLGFLLFLGFLGSPNPALAGFACVAACSVLATGVNL
jgi:hypothetical protein